MKYAIDNQLTLLNGHYPTDTPAQLTFISNNGCSIPDLCFVSLKLLKIVKSFNVLSSVTSCHFPILLEPSTPSSNQTTPIDMNVPLPPHELPAKIRWDVTSSAAFVSSLPELDPSQLGYQYFSEIMTQSLSDSNLLTRPKQTSSGAKLRISNPPWFCELCSLLKKQTKSALQLLRNSSPENLEQSKNNYLQTRKEYQIQLKISKQNYKSDIVNVLLNHRASSDFWHAVKKMKSREYQRVQIHPDNWVDHFENLFSSSIITPSHPLPDSPAADLDYPISLNEITCVLHKLKNNKAPGHDGIPNEVWKSLPPIYVQHIQNMFNNILTTGNIPVQWTTILFQPIFKKNDPLLPQNYRPIAPAPTILKIFSTIISKRVHDCKVHNNKISEFQAGCKNGTGTHEHLFSLLTLIQSRIRHPRGRFYVVFVDLRSAYDSPGHADLWDVLSRAGMGSKIINLLISLYSRASGQGNSKMASQISSKFGNAFCRVSRNQA